MPEGKFDLIYADPPWNLNAWADPAKFAGWKGGRRLPYAPMDLSAICRLPIPQFAAPNSILAIWTNGASPKTTLRVIEAWGFTDACEGLNWVKVAAGTGRPYPGLGRSTRKDSESLWLARRGNGLPRQDKGVGQTIVDPRREHSRKPDEAYVRLERLYGDVRRLELFGRRERKDWVLWGNELLPPDAEPMLPWAEGEMLAELRHPGNAP
jgi:N6-adenosine-specific RNA methylase IME4